MPKFFFSRLSLIADKGELDKAEFLYKGLTSDNEIEYRKDNYKFIGAEVLKQGSKLYLVGYLTKYKPLSPDRVVNEENKVVDIQVTNKVLAEVRFIIDVESSIIIHEEDRSHIPKESFGLRFKSLFEKHFNDEFTKIDISAITENYQFFERVKEVTEIKKIKIELVPSNPNNSELWRSVDEQLNADRISKYKEEQINTRKGESIVVDDKTQQKFYMSEDGYGNSTVSGLDANGEPIKVSTEDVTSQSKIDIPGELNDFKEQIERMQEKLNEIIRRTNEN